MKEREFERQLKAFANRRRLLILWHLKQQKELSVGDIAVSIRLSFKATSRHLSILTAANILEREQRSLHIFYRIHHALPPVPKFIVGHIPLIRSN